VNTLIAKIIKYKTNKLHLVGGELLTIGKISLIQLIRGGIPTAITMGLLQQPQTTIRFKCQGHVNRSNNGLIEQRLGQTLRLAISRLVGIL